MYFHIMSCEGSSDFFLVPPPNGVYTVPPLSIQPVPVQFLLLRDGVSQEFNQRFELKINIIEPLPSVFDEFSDTLRVTIVDSDGK